MELFDFILQLDFIRWSYELIPVPFDCYYHLFFTLLSCQDNAVND